MNHYVYQILSLSPNEEGVLKIYSGLRSCEGLPEEDTEYMGSGIAISRAIEKYGREKFMKMIIGKFSTREEAHDCETAWLSKQFDFHGRDWKRFKTFNYNLRLNENSHDGFSCSPETRKKLSEARIGKYAGENHPLFGKQHSDETKQKMSEALIGKYAGENNPFFGKQHSDEAKQKMSEARSGANHYNFGKQHSDETKQKMSAALTGEKSASFKGLSIGTKDNQTIVFCGGRDIHSRGFDPGTISKVINGKAPHHKGFTFIRTADHEQLRELLRTATFYDDVSRQRIEEFIKQ